ncbi:hypothetical protein JCGZ_03216 [Jatropha curcas]|uniref:Uncharacterized protein n=1 Tax=Jatropha curcas TaxID=180498 RepID=A0A067KXZ5_JATCU|nr:hypothetical protein JCGZ_03216 [Jatropha curcas]
MVRSGGGAGGGAMQSSLSYCLCLVRTERGAEWRALAASSCSEKRRWRARRSDLAGVAAAASSFASHRCGSGHRRRRRKRKKKNKKKKKRGRRWRWQCAGGAGGSPATGKTQTGEETGPALEI